jgi:DNA-binding MarR family transcriptional regulator
MKMKQTDGPAAEMERERAALDLWAELTSATGSVRTRLADLLDAELGILPEEADLLVLLGEAPEQRLRMVDVSTSLRLSKSGATRLVDRLAERGLVVRAPCPKDRRVVYAGLTDEGRRTAAAAAPALAAGVAQQLAGRLSQRELEHLTELLGRLADAREAGARVASAASPTQTIWSEHGDPI